MNTNLHACPSRDCAGSVPLNNSSCTRLAQALKSKKAAKPKKVKAPKAEGEKKAAKPKSDKPKKPKAAKPAGEEFRALSLCNSSCHLLAQQTVAVTKAHV